MSAARWFGMDLEDYLEMIRAGKRPSADDGRWSGGDKLHVEADCVVAYEQQIREEFGRGEGPDDGDELVLVLDFEDGSRRVIQSVFVEQHDFYLRDMVVCNMPPTAQEPA